MKKYVYLLDWNNGESWEDEWHYITHVFSNRKDAVKFIKSKGYKESNTNNYIYTKPGQYKGIEESYTIKTLELIGG